MPVMRVSAQLIALIMSIFLPVSYTYGYGSIGHEIVGEIASAHLCAGAVGEVERLLDGESLGRASRWPDWIRKDPKWRRSGPWHYINVPDDGHIAAVTGQANGDVIWAIRKFRDELADRRLGQARRAEALRFLAHFVADVHQPLHVGRNEDRGGNRIVVSVDGRKSNLHKLWDAQWLLKLDRSSNGYDAAGQIDSIDALSASQIDILLSAGVPDWARESQVLRPRVYGFRSVGPDRPVIISTHYAAQALEVSRQRLAAAGIRLAGTLNDIFCSQSAEN